MPHPLIKPLGKMLRLQHVDLRCVHSEEEYGAPAPCWSLEKGTTMSNIVHWEKALRRKGAAVKVLIGDHDGRGQGQIM